MTQLVLSVVPYPPIAPPVPLDSSLTAIPQPVFLCVLMDLQESMVSVKPVLHHVKTAILLSPIVHHASYLSLNFSWIQPLVVV